MHGCMCVYDRAMYMDACVCSRGLYMDACVYGRGICMDACADRGMCIHFSPPVQGQFLGLGDPLLAKEHSNSAGKVEVGNKPSVWG